jgi:nucleotidyltransferase substrate binding protein (TIGR01987 family)
MTDFFASFTASLARLDEALTEKKTAITRDAAIQRFEFTVELAWKSVQKFLRDQKMICRSPKECLKEAFRFGLIQDDPQWIAMFEDRNMTAHTYDEELAERIYNRLEGYSAILHALRDRLAKKFAEE